MLNANKSDSAGFTIVELLVVIVVIGILAAVTIVSYTGINQKAIAASLKSDLSTSSRTLKMYYTDNGHYPADLDANYCPTGPTDSRYCLKASAGTKFYYYSPGPSYSTFSLQAANNTDTVVYGVLDNSSISAAAPVTAIASISGDIGYGGTALAGATTPSDAAVAYQWKIANTVGGTYTNIPGATSASYTPVSGDVGKFLKVTATGIGFSSGVVTTSATAALVRFAPNGNYYLSSDGTLRAGVNLAASGATYGTFDTEYDADDNGVDCGGSGPNKAKITNNDGIHLYDSCWFGYDYNFLLENNMVFKTSSTVTINIAGSFQTDSGWDGDDGNFVWYSVPVGVAGSYVTVN